MTTPRATPMVSAAAWLGRATVVAVALGAAACAGGPHSVTQAEYETPPATIQFDNEATVHVDVYVVTGQYQWKLGRVLPGARVVLRVPRSAIESTMGLVQLTVIPGSQMSGQAVRDPRAVPAIAQPMSELLSYRWAFRPAATVGMQLQGTRVSPRFTR